MPCFCTMSAAMRVSVAPVSGRTSSVNGLIVAAWISTMAIGRLACCQSGFSEDWTTLAWTLCSVFCSVFLNSTDFIAVVTQAFSVCPLLAHLEQTLSFAGHLSLMWTDP